MSILLRLKVGELVLAASPMFSSCELCTTRLPATIDRFMWYSYNKDEVLMRTFNNISCLEGYQDRAVVPKSPETFLLVASFRRGIIRRLG
jgi:hypothetical protein